MIGILDLVQTVLTKSTAVVVLPQTSQTEPEVAARAKNRARLTQSCHLLDYSFSGITSHGNGSIDWSGWFGVM